MKNYYLESHAPDHFFLQTSDDKQRRRQYTLNNNQVDQDVWGTYIGIFVCFILFLFFVFVLWYPMSYYYNYDNDWNNNGIHDARERYYVHRHGIW